MVRIVCQTDKRQYSINVQYQQTPHNSPRVLLLIASLNEKRRTAANRKQKVTVWCDTKSPVKPTFHLLRHVTTRHHKRRACQARRVQVQSFVLWICINLKYNFWKNEVEMSTPVYAVATPPITCREVAPVTLVVTSVSCRVEQQARHSTSRLFPVPKCVG